MEWQPVDATHACGYVIEFSDGGEAEEQVLHKGSEASCRRVLEMTPAVMYSGSRPVKECYGVIVELPPVKYPEAQ